MSKNSGTNFNNLFKILVQKHNLCKWIFFFLFLSAFINCEISLIEHKVKGVLTEFDNRIHKVSYKYKPENDAEDYFTITIQTESNTTSTTGIKKLSSISLKMYDEYYKSTTYYKGQQINSLTIDNAITIKNDNVYICLGGIGEYKLFSYFQLLDPEDDNIKGYFKTFDPGYVNQRELQCSLYIDEAMVFKTFNDYYIIEGYLPSTYETFDNSDKLYFEKSEEERKEPILAIYSSSHKTDGSYQGFKLTLGNKNVLKIVFFKNMNDNDAENIKVTELTYIIEKHYISHVKKLPGDKFSIDILSYTGDRDNERLTYVNVEEFSLNDSPKSMLASKKFLKNPCPENSYVINYLEFHNNTDYYFFDVTCHKGTGGELFRVYGVGDIPNSEILFRTKETIERGVAFIIPKTPGQFTVKNSGDYLILCPFKWDNVTCTKCKDTDTLYLNPNGYNLCLDSINNTNNQFEFNKNSKKIATCSLGFVLDTNGNYCAPVGYSCPDCDSCKEGFILCDNYCYFELDSKTKTFKVGDGKSSCHEKSYSYYIEADTYKCVDELPKNVELVHPKTGVYKKIICHDRCEKCFGNPVFQDEKEANGIINLKCTTCKEKYEDNFQIQVLNNCFSVADDTQKTFQTSTLADHNKEVSSCADFSLTIYPNEYICKSRPKSGTYLKNKETGIIDHCDSSCIDCTNGVETKQIDGVDKKFYNCLSCSNKSEYLIKGNCIEPCKVKNPNLPYFYEDQCYDKCPAKTMPSNSPLFNKDVCVPCKDNNYLTKGDECITEEECKDPYFKDFNNMQCVLCSEYNISTPNYYEGNCYEKCPEHTKEFRSKCYPCKINDKNVPYCDVPCKEFGLINYHGECLEECPENWIKDENDEYCIEYLICGICFNGGECNKEKRKCECINGYEGDHCQYIVIDDNKEKGKDTKKEESKKKLEDNPIEFLNIYISKNQNLIRKYDTVFSLKYVIDSKNISLDIDAKNEYTWNIYGIDISKENKGKIINITTSAFVNGNNQRYFKILKGTFKRDVNYTVTCKIKTNYESKKKQGI